MRVNSMSKIDEVLYLLKHKKSQREIERSSLDKNNLIELAVKLGKIITDSNFDKNELQFVVTTHLSISSYKITQTDDNHATVDVIWSISKSDSTNIEFNIIYMAEIFDNEWKFVYVIDRDEAQIISDLSKANQ